MRVAIAAVLALAVSLFAAVIEFKTPYTIKPPLGVSLNRNSPLVKGMDFGFLMNEGGGVPRDLVGKTGTWTYTNGTPPWVRGLFGSAIQFLSNGTIYLGSAYTPPTQNMSVVYVARPNTTGDTYASFGYIGTDNGSSECRGLVPYSGTIYWDFGGYSAPNRLTFTPAASYFGQWHVLVFTAGSSGMGLWSDGVLMASSGTAVTRTNTGTGYRIGGSGSNNSNGNDVAAFYFYSRILSNAEIQAISANPYIIAMPRTTAFRFPLVPPATQQRIVTGPIMF